MILFDTDVCIELLRGNNKVLEKRKMYNDPVAISFISVAELYYGVFKSGYANKNISLVEEFLLTVKVIESSLAICRKFGELKTNLAEEGKIISDADLFIASTSITSCDKLITGNINHFNRIENLRIENWIR